MKFLRFPLKLVLTLLALWGLSAIVLYYTGNIHLLKAVRSTYLVGKTGPTIDDYTKFINREVATSSIEEWVLHPDYNSQELDNASEECVEKWETAAFLIVKDNQLLFERYWGGYSENSLTNSFSMAKSLTSLCIGAAIKEGKIKGVNQKVGDFLPAFAEGKKSNISIEHLLNMTSGIDFGESYGDPLGFMAKTYYGEDLYDLTINNELKYEPGTVWKYQGGNTLLLSFILKEATGKSLGAYFSEMFWQPIGAEKQALWSLNKKDGIEKSYCCFYSNARDFAKIGQLMLDSGMWRGKSTISKEFFSSSLSPVNVKNEFNKQIDYYGYQWWFGDFENTPFYYARGILGQYIVFIPEWNLVFVRLGHKRDPTPGARVPKDLMEYLAIVEKFAN